MSLLSFNKKIFPEGNQWIDLQNWKRQSSFGNADCTDLQNQKTNLAKLEEAKLEEAKQIYRITKTEQIHPADVGETTRADL